MQETAFGPIRFIPGINRGKYPYCHSIYIEGAKILIDPASDRERLKRLRDEQGVEQVWLSHWHEDHFMDLDLFDDLPLGIHPLDAPPLADVESFLDAYDIRNPAFRESWRGIVTEMFHFRPRQPQIALEAGTRELGDLAVEILHTPGHTPGHLCFFFPEIGVLFLGDYDLTPFGPWYGDRDSSIPDTIASVRRLEALPARTWLTCHETGVFENQPGQLWSNYLDVIAKRETRLLEFLGEARTQEQIINAWIVYLKAREPQDFYRFAEWAIIRKHLVGLINAGRVVWEADRYRLA
jgi:glyoxylase-like metal-dependent hydrolase (beta-lactamase superfamily II)